MLFRSGKFGSDDPGTRSIACWMFLIGGSSVGSSAGIKSLKSYNKDLISGDVETA